MDESRTRQVPPRADLKLGDTLVERALEGLRQSVAETFGTGNHIAYEDGRTEPIINAAGVTVWAKTGTAQAPPMVVDLDGDGVAETKLNDLLHAWFVGLVGDSRTRKPQLAVVVIIEHGGSGGKTAGPVANQIIRALQDEGYLAGVPSEGDLPQRTQRRERSQRSKVRGRQRFGCHGQRLCVARGVARKSSRNIARASPKRLAHGTRPSTLETPLCTLVYFFSLCVLCASVVKDGVSR